MPGTESVDQSHDEGLPTAAGSSRQTQMCQAAWCCSPVSQVD